MSLAKVLWVSQLIARLQLICWSIRWAHVLRALTFESLAKSIAIFPWQLQRQGRSGSLSMTPTPRKNGKLVQRRQGVQQLMWKHTLAYFNDWISWRWCKTQSEYFCNRDKIFIFGYRFLSSTRMNSANISCYVQIFAFQQLSRHW